MKLHIKKFAGRWTCWGMSMGALITGEGENPSEAFDSCRDRMVRFAAIVSGTPLDLFV